MSYARCYKWRFIFPGTSQEYPIYAQFFSGDKHNTLHLTGSPLIRRPFKFRFLCRAQEKSIGYRTVEVRIAIPVTTPASPWVRYPGPMGLSVFLCKPHKGLYGSWERDYVSCLYPAPKAVSIPLMSCVSAQVSRSGNSPSEWFRQVLFSTTQYILLLCRDLSFLPYVLVLHPALAAQPPSLVPGHDVVPFCCNQGTAHPLACTSPLPCHWHLCLSPLAPA